MEKVKNNLAALLKVKTIVTLLLTVVFCILALAGVIPGKDFLSVFSMIIIFYFGTQSGKKDAAADSPTEDEAAATNKVYASKQ